MRSSWQVAGVEPVLPPSLEGRNRPENAAALRPRPERKFVDKVTYRLPGRVTFDTGRQKQVFTLASCLDLHKTLTKPKQHEHATFWCATSARVAQPFLSNS